MQVTKRNGTKQPFDITKIRKIINYACDNVDVNPLELESNLTKRFKSGISTSDIQNELILVSSSLATPENPDWIIASGRLKMYDIQRSVFKKTKIDYSTPFSDVVKYMTRNGYYDQTIHQFYEDDELNSLTKYIDVNADKDTSIGSVLSLESKYLIKNQKGVIELPQHANMAICLYLNRFEKDKKVRFQNIIESYKMIANGFISIATPFKANLRKKSGNLSSCFIVHLDDNLDSITKVIDDVSQISSSGGGVGVYLSPLRPSKSLVGNIEAGNVVNLWAKIFDSLASAVNQKGVRKAGITVSLDVWHKDLLEFIEMKTEVGDLRNKCFDLFPQVLINDVFMEKLDKNAEWYLVDHYEVKRKLGIDLIIPKMYEKHFNDIENAIKTGKIKNYIKTTALEIWKKILTVYVETGDFYIVHKDNMNRTNPMYDNGDYIQSANLCVESFSPISPSTNFKKGEIINGKVVDTYNVGKTHVCNLISINIGKILNNEKLLEKATRYSVKMLNQAIDCTHAPTPEAQNHNDIYKVIGIGIIGGHDYLAYNKLSYLKEEGLNKMEELSEKISYYALDESCNLAQIYGSFKEFDNSYFKKGMYLGKTGKELQEQSVASLDWVSLMEKAKLGVRNLMLLGYAPNTSTGILQFASASYLPVFSKFYYDSMAKMNTPFAPRYLKERFWYYNEAWTIDPRNIMELTTRMQKWVDAGMSMEMVVNIELFGDIGNFSKKARECFKRGMKAIYYGRFINPNSNTKNDKQTCVSCAN